MTSPDVAEIVARLRERIDTRLNNVLCEMKPEYDDSITGFNEAWDIVREIFNENERVESLYAAWKARPHYRRREAADALDRLKAELDEVRLALQFEREQAIDDHKENLAIRSKLEAELDEARDRADTWKHIAAERGSHQARERVRADLAEAALAAMKAELDEARTTAVMEFATAVLHGDEAHRTWLLAAAAAFVTSAPLPPPNGLGRAEKAEAALAASAKREEALRQKLEYVANLILSEDARALLFSELARVALSNGESS